MRQTQKAQPQVCREPIIGDLTLPFDRRRRFEPRSYRPDLHKLGRPPYNKSPKGSNSLVLLHYKLKHNNSKIASASRHYEAHASGLLDMQRHCMSSQTFD